VTIVIKFSAIIVSGHKQIAANKIPEYPLLEAFLE
jgi:hypothetical protein